MPTQFLVVTPFETPAVLAQLPGRIVERAIGRLTSSPSPSPEPLDRWITISKAVGVYAQAALGRPSSRLDSAVHFAPRLVEWCTLFPRPPVAVLLTHAGLFPAMGIQLEYLAHFDAVCHVRQVPLFLIPHPSRNPMPELWGDPCRQFLLDLMAEYDAGGKIAIPPETPETLRQGAPVVDRSKRARGAPRPPERMPRALAVAWLTQQLTDGPQRATVLYALWHATGLGSRATLLRATRKLGVIVSGETVRTCWSLRGVTE